MTNLNLCQSCGNEGFAACECLLVSRVAEWLYDFDGSEKIGISAYKDDAEDLVNLVRQHNQQPLERQGKCGEGESLYTDKDAEQILKIANAAIKRNGILKDAVKSMVDRANIPGMHFPEARKQIIEIGLNALHEIEVQPTTSQQEAREE